MLLLAILTKLSSSAGLTSDIYFFDLDIPVIVEAREGLNVVTLTKKRRCCVKPIAVFAWEWMQLLLPLKWTFLKGSVFFLSVFPTVPSERVSSG
jgi:hypothetical protein